MIAITITAITSICTTIVAGFLLYLLQKANRKNDELKEERERIRKEKEDDEKNWKKIITQAIVQLLRIQLCEYHNKYMEIRTIPTYAYDNWCRLYTQYKALGGNGMVTHMNEDIESLNMKNK